MSASVGYATLEVIPSAKGFGKALSGQINGEAGTAGKSAGGALGKGLMVGLGALAVGIGSVLGGALAVGKVAEFTMQASDLNETISKSNAIFGSASGAMLDWSSTAATSLGLTQAQALAASAGFGDMFSQLGFASDTAASMSQQVVQLSADLGSFNNLETADVTDRMSAAFRGEYDSLQALIPNINAARVEQEAMAMTGKSNASALTAQEKAAAVLAIVQKDGAAAAGDFAKTSIGLANGLKILGANTEQATTAIGNAFMPMGAATVAILNEVMSPLSAATGAMTVFGQTAMDAFSASYAETGSLDTAIAAMSESIMAQLPGLATTITTALQQVITLVQAAIPVITQQVIPALLATIQMLLPPLLEAIIAAVPLLLQAASTLFTALVNALAIAGPPLITAIVTLIGGLAEILILNMPALLQAGLLMFMALIQAVGEILPPLIEALAAMLPSLVETIAAMLPDLLAAGLEALMGLVMAVAENLPNILEALVSMVPVLVQTIIGFLPDFLKAMLNALVALVTAVAQSLPLVIRALTDMIPGLVTTLIDMGPELLPAFFEALTSLITALIDIAPDVLSAVWDLITALIEEFSNVDLLQVGKDIIRGLISGITSMGGELVSSIKRTVTDKLPAFVKDALGIHSPSRVFMALGGYTAEGMALGISRGASAVQRAADGLVPDAPKVSAFSSPDVDLSARIGGGSSGSPEVLVLVDQDGALIGRMQVEAGRVQTGAVTPLHHGRPEW
ncbi:hypothetical protein [Cellulosimicrobium sp. TH-20]|uniref:phage tail protein n=1 Tax=Cellulosimicrobium sp. TH-20 TaxID=1980001 RepID=UPI00119D92D1|nr:hypothetical protein [Cellulosimicrobium sp. TH-20]